MTGIQSTDAHFDFPLIAVAADGGVMVIYDIETLLDRAAAECSRRDIGMELAGPAGKRWIVTGLYVPEAPARRWWRFGRQEKAPPAQFEVTVSEPISLEALRDHIQAWGEATLKVDHDIAADLRAAKDVADLAAIVTRIEMRAPVLAILAGDASIAIRPAADVARRAIALLAMVHIAQGANRMKVAEWFHDNGLLASLSREELDLLTLLRPSDEQIVEASWQAECLAVLLWALGLAEMPSPEEKCDISLFDELIPPGSADSVDQFVAAASLRSTRELAACADQYWTRLNKAATIEVEEGAPRPTEQSLAYGRSIAVQWIIDPATPWD